MSKMCGRYFKIVLAICIFIVLSYSYYSKWRNDFERAFYNKIIIRVNSEKRRNDHLNGKLLLVSGVLHTNHRFVTDAYEMEVYAMNFLREYYEWTSCTTFNLWNAENCFTKAWSVKEKMKVSTQSIASIGTYKMHMNFSKHFEDFHETVSLYAKRRLFNNSFVVNYCSESDDAYQVGDGLLKFYASGLNNRHYTVLGVFDNNVLVPSRSDLVREKFHFVREGKVTLEQMYKHNYSFHNMVFFSFDIPMLLMLLPYFPFAYWIFIV